MALQYDPANGYYLAFSGGKDSQALYHVARLAGVQFRARMSLTSVDPPEVIRFVRQQYPDVELIKPRDSIFNIAVRRQILPTMRVRWCCAECKENAGAGRVTLIGIRHEESSRRARRNEVEISSRKFSGTLTELDAYREARAEKESHPHRGRKPKAEQITIVNASGERTLGCINGKESLLISPIIHWTEDDVWQFLRAIGAAHCSLYDEGWHRIGCICCPMSSAKQKREEEKRWPHVKRSWIKAIRAIRAGGGICQHVYLVEHPLLHPPLLPPPTSSTTKSAANSYKKDIWRAYQPGTLVGFSDSSSSARLTDEQEQQIAENIYDWWTSGKAYKSWYAEKFCQQSLNFDDENNDDGRPQ